MATPACNTFFSLPDLLSHLLPFLSTLDLTQLLLTNRTINSIYHFAFWGDIELTSSRPSRLLCGSPEALKAFGNNIDSVQSLKWNVSFSWYYIRALWKYLDTTPSLSHQWILTDALTHPKWGQLVGTLHDNSIVPLPPLLQLKSYTGKFRTTYKAPKRISQQPLDACTAHESHQHQLLWLLRLNRATLSHVRFEEPPFLSVRLVRDFCRTISQLDHLRSIQLVGPSRNLTPQFVKVLFFTCPKSLVEFYVLGGLDMAQEEKLLQPEQDDWDFDQGPLRFREEPLHHLTRLEISAPKSPNCLTNTFLGPILKQCPALETLRLRSIAGSHTFQNVAMTLRDHCPNITDLTVDSAAVSNGEALMHIMEQISGQRLEVVCLKWLFDRAPSKLAVAAITRHSETLRRIEFRDCEELKSSTVQVILMTCRALEVLRTQGEFSKICPILLKDAVEAEWASTRIRVLEIGVEFTPDGRDPVYVSDTTMATWTEQDHNHWNMLDKFYTQIGSLVELEVLNIKSSGTHPSEENEVTIEVPFRKACLPGLLALEDVTTGQLGFLSRWVGLIRLRELCGSFLWTNEEAASRIGASEVAWFVEHLPSLRKASFLAIPYMDEFGYEYVLPRAILDLRTRRPGLCVNDFM
ncbi:hypothetical protein BGZ96_008886 [Linnemannia gamsii]|uniref:F-box domain-containing protein n=1 Tax=Linnemannia gamsii TaxID=64522 RepID=A0ABQ7JYE1_9FUNG|nr:hypothetical protein BGZ96_008886 [Linnemannia gamsii]